MCVCVCVYVCICACLLLFHFVVVVVVVVVICLYLSVDRNLVAWTRPFDNTTVICFVSLFITLKGHSF